MVADTHTATHTAIAAGTQAAAADETENARESAEEQAPSIHAWRARPQGNKNNGPLTHRADRALELTVQYAQHMGQRICIECGEDQPLEAYPKLGRGRSQVCSSCKAKAAGGRSAGSAAASQAERPLEIRATHEAPEDADADETLRDVVSSAAAGEMEDAGDRDADDSRDSREGDEDLATLPVLLDPRVAGVVQMLVRGVARDVAREVAQEAVSQAAEEVVPVLAAREVEREVARGRTRAVVAPMQDQKGQLPPVLAALLEMLPGSASGEGGDASGREWRCASERGRWIAAFTAALDYLFVVRDRGDDDGAGCQAAAGGAS